MKKLFLILLIFISISTLFSQSPVENQKKYDYFRQRLRDDFVVVDPTNRQGTNIPVAVRNEYGAWLGYGENTYRDCIAVYMMLLSTEYAKNKKYGLDNTLTLNELSYLLIAVERLDANAEKYFRIHTLANLMLHFC